MEQDQQNQRQQGHRRTVDHANGFSRWIIERQLGAFTDHQKIRKDASYIIDILPPTALRQSPITSLCSKFVHTSLNKIKHPVLVVTWTPEGRRLLAGSMSGEFTLWNGMAFNFETIMQAHEHAVRTMVYSHSDDWLLSGDNEGIVKYWQPNFNNVNILQAHSTTVRDLAFSPNDSRFATASDDATVKIFNFGEAACESTLTGHGWDVKSVDWHPTLGLLASGSKDNLVKLWDPRAGGKCLTTLHGHKNTISKTTFQRTGGQRLLASGARDSTVRIFDLRAMKDMAVLRSEGSDSDISAVTWHPIHPGLITTGSHDGCISHFMIDAFLPENTSSLMPVMQIKKAHDWPIWSLQYHPLGHILCSGGNDKMTRFWCRARPNDETAFVDRYYLGEEGALAAANSLPSQGNQKTAGSSGIPGIPGIPGLR